VEEEKSPPERKSEKQQFAALQVATKAASDVVNKAADATKFFLAL